MRRSRVFIVHEQLRRHQESGELRPRFDFRDAELFGDVEFLLDRESHPDEIGVIDTIHQRLNDYDSDVDYIVLVGAPTLMGIVTAIAAWKSRDGRVQFLRWSKTDMRYSPVTIDLQLHPTERQASV